jgi:hypothetical protein
MYNTTHQFCFLQDQEMRQSEYHCTQRMHL